MCSLQTRKYLHYEMDQNPYLGEGLVVSLRGDSGVVRRDNDVPWRFSNWPTML